MKKRVKQPEITRSLILKAAGTGFARNGYAATGIGDIAEVSGLTRGALFHHFVDKQGLALAWIQEELAGKVQDECITPFQSVGSFPVWKSSWIRLMSGIEQDHPASLLNRLGCEWSGDPVLRSAMEGVLLKWCDEARRQLDQGQRDGWIHPSIRPDDESAILVSQACGASFLVRLAEDPRAASLRFERSFGSYLETLKAE